MRLLSEARRLLADIRYLLEMVSFICVSEDFLCLLETPILKNTFQQLLQYFQIISNTPKKFLTNCTIITVMLKFLCMFQNLPTCLKSHRHYLHQNHIRYEIHGDQIIYCRFQKKKKNTILRLLHH